MQKHNTIAIVTISLLLPYNVFIFAITVTATQIKQGRGKDQEQLKVLVVHLGLPMYVLTKPQIICKEDTADTVVIK